MTRYFEINWSDLKWEKQQEILEDIKQNMLENMELEAEKRRTALVNQKGEEWEDVDWQFIANDLYGWVSVEKFNQKSLMEVGVSLENYIDEAAQGACWKGFKYLQGEVEL